MFVLTNNQKGALAEEAIALAAVELDVVVARPNLDARYDLILDLGTRLLRVQCKWATCDGHVMCVNCRGSWYSPGRGYVTSHYGADEVDAIGVYCADLKQCFLIPIEVVATRRVIHLRIQAPSNGQRAALHWAADYEFPGAVAQLARAPRWQRGGRRFESDQLHPSASAGRPAEVGANEFRNRFGWYMQRAAAGEEFQISRRGRPLARLLPPLRQPLEQTELLPKAS